MGAAPGTVKQVGTSDAAGSEPNPSSAAGWSLPALKPHPSLLLTHLTDDERLHDEGVADEAAGDVQEGFGRARRKVGDAINDIGDSIKR